MMDDGWEPIAQDDGWEPVTAPPLAQLSQPDAVLPWQKISVDPEVPLAAATRYTPLGLLPLAAAGLAGGMQKLMKLTEPVGLAAAGEGGGDLGALSDAMDSEGVAQDIGNDLAKDFHKKGSQSVTDTITSIRDALSFEPTTARAKAVAAPMDWAMEKVGKFAEKAGTKVLEATSGLPTEISAGLAAATDTAMQIAPLILGEKVVRGTADSIKAAREAGRLGIDTLGEAGGDLPKFAPTDLPLEKAGTLDVPPVTLSPAAQNRARLMELDKKRGNLTPDETAEHSELQYLDRRQGKVLGSGEPIEGVGTASALHENHDVENTPQVHTDIDNFKETNDQKGHPAGDVLIKHVGESLAVEFPPDEHGTPQVYHHGGDEFTIVPRDGETLAEVHKRVQDVQEQVRNTPIELTDTAGVTSTHPGVDFSVGSGDTHAAAHESITKDKLDREARGIRRPRNNRSTDQPGAEQGAADRGVASAERPQEQVGGRQPEVQPDNGQVLQATREQPGGAETNAPSVPRTEPVRTESGNVSEVAAPGRDSRVANAATYVDRATRGVEQLPEAGHKSWAESKSQAAEKIAADPEYAKNLAAEVAAKPRAISDVETMALGAERQKLQDAYHQAHDDILKARESADPVSEAQALAKRTDVENQLDLNERATKHAGTDIGRAMAARNAMHAEDYTPARNITRAKVAFGDKFNEGIRKQVEDLSTRLTSAEAQLARQEANKPAPSMKVSRAEKLSPDERMQAQIEKKMASLQEAIERRTKACPL